MSFKHINFTDSQTMREFEKLAIKKGLIKPEQIKKEASEKPKDYSVSDDLTSNILKLCSGLRYSGYEVFASEVEDKFLLHKKAEAELNSFKKTAKKTEDEAIIEQTNITIAKLKSKGFISLAKKLEDDLYNVYGESLKKLHDEAHPKSYYSTNDKDSLIENIYEQKEEMNKVLKTSSQIIDELKKVI